MGMMYLTSQACFSTTFLKNCCRGDSLRTTTCPKTVFGGKQWHAPCKILSLQQSFFMSSEFHGDHKTHRGEVNLATLSFGNTTRLKTVVSVLGS